MATATRISLDVYDKTTFHPDVEYVDGELKERNVGKWEHSRLQFLIGLWFGQNEAAWKLRGVTEQRMRVSDTKIRIPDVALLPPGPQPPVILEPPVLVVEILSPDDRYGDIMTKLRDYLSWGVRSVWVVDPEAAEGQMWQAPDHCTFSSTLTVAGTGISLHLPELFEQLKQS